MKIYANFHVIALKMLKKEPFLSKKKTFFCHHCHPSATSSATT